MRIGLLAAFVVLLVLGLRVSPTDADEFGLPVPGQRVYDRAEVLTQEELAAIETRAAAVARAGAPTVVYIRRQDASRSETEGDARELMDAWSVQSAPGAQDGFVVFLNLEPTDPRHGEAVLYAGRQHVRSGVLTEGALQRVFDREMRPLLADGRTAEGIAAGLDATAAALAAGPPEPSPAARIAGALAHLPLTLLTSALAIALAFVSVRTWRARPTAPPVAPTTAPPEQLPAPLVGALVSGRVGDAPIEAALLELASRGALVLEPVGRKEVQVRLLDAARAPGALDQAVWRGLTAAADADGVVPPKSLRKVRRSWGEARRLLRDDMEARGWYDPRVSERRRPLYVGGALAMVGAAIGVGVALFGRAPEGVVGSLLLAAAGVVALTIGGLLPATTAAGAWKASPWRGYRAGLKDARRTPEPLFDLDEALPYAVAMGSAGLLQRHLEAASKRGYAPAWFVADAPTAAAGNAGFYPYWAGFHSSVGADSSAGGSGAGASSGGASAGGSF